MRYFICACIIVQHAIFPVGIHALRRGSDHRGKAFVVVAARSLGNHTLETDVNHSVFVASDNDQGNQSGVEGFGTSSFARDFVGEQGEGSDASSLDSLVEEFNAKHVVNMTTDEIRRADEMIKDDTPEMTSAHAVQKSQDVEFAESDRQRLRRIPSFIGSRASTFAPSSFLQTPELSEREKLRLANELVLPEEINVRAKVLHHLGRGASGHVFELEAKCDDDESNPDTRKVALKVMEEDHNYVMQSMQQFRIEAKLMERFDSPYVLPLHGPAVEDDTRKMFLMMQLANSGDLFGVVKEGHGSDASRVALWFQVVIGLGYLHRRGVTHMDVKPENVVIECRGHNSTDRLLDQRTCRAMVADVGMVCESKDWIRFDIQWGDKHGCRNTDTMAACLKNLYADAKAGNYAVYKESEYKEILSSERLMAEEEALNDNDKRPYFPDDYESEFLKKYYGKVYSKDNLAFRNTNVFFDKEKYPITIIYYAYPDGCDFRGTPSYVSPITLQSKYKSYIRRHVVDDIDVDIRSEPFGHSDADIWSMATMLYVTFKREFPPWAVFDNDEDRVRATHYVMSKVPLRRDLKVMFGVDWDNIELQAAWKAWDERRDGNCPPRTKRSDDKLKFFLGTEVVMKEICQTKGMTFFSQYRKWAPAIAIMRVDEVVEEQHLRHAPGDMKELMKMMLTDAGSIDLGEIMQMMPRVMEGLSPGKGPKYEDMINLLPDPSAYMYTPPTCLSERYLPYPVPLPFAQKLDVNLCTKQIKKASKPMWDCGFTMIVPRDWICCRCIIQGTGEKHYWRKQVLPVPTTFQPPWESDDIGFEWIEANGKVNAVTNQALVTNNVVRENWVMTEIDGAEYTHQLLMQKIQGSEKFAITFSLEQDHKGACIISSRDEH